MRNKMLNGFLIGLLAAVVILLLPAATTNYQTGKLQTITCGPVDVGNSATDLDLCAIDFPQAAKLVAAQCYASAIASDSSVKWIEAGSDLMTAVDFTTAGDPVFFTLTDTNIADEAQVELRVTTDSGDSLTNFSCALTFYYK